MSPRPIDDETLRKLQRDTFAYFLQETNPTNGLVSDSTGRDSPSSIAAIGLGLAAYTVGCELDLISRIEAVERTLATLRFFWNSRQGEDLDATGYKGFYYHYLDMHTGRRVWRSELSTIDTTYLLAGMLTAAVYFDRDTADEREIRSMADALYRRVDWQWALNGTATVSHGWKPESGFLKYRWEGYNEALLLYVLALGSPTYPIPAACYQAWTRTYRWKKLYGQELLYGGPLFIHQLSHVWIDFRGIQDEFMRAKDMDYFENSRRAAYVQQQYAIRNPKGFMGYNEHCWGITAGNGPGNAIHRVDGIERRFFGYLARGVPYGPDDGTIAPWAVVASLPFAPEIVLPTLEHINTVYPEANSEYGFNCSLNPTFPNDAEGGHGWISKGYYGLEQGPVVLMIENYYSDFLWQLMQRCPYVVTGLRQAGFTNGWL